MLVEADQLLRGVSFEGLRREERGFGSDGFVGLPGDEEVEVALAVVAIEDLVDLVSEQEVPALSRRGEAGLLTQDFLELKCAHFS